jgi:hypothetical protein
MSRFLEVAAALSLMGAIADARPTAAQEMWLAQSGARTLGVELLKPNFEGAFGVPSSGVAAFATLRWPIGAYERLVVEASFAQSGSINYPGPPAYPYYSYGVSPGSGSSLGNPYLGIETGGPEARWVGEFGVRLPIASKNSAALIAGADADVERCEAFAGPLFSISGYENLKLRSASGLSFRARIGAGLAFKGVTYDYAVGPGYSERARDSWLGYGVQLGYERGRLAVLTGISGRASAGRQFVLTAALVGGSVRPGISLRVPLDAPTQTVMKTVLGLTVSFEFPYGRAQ